MTVNQRSAPFLSIAALILIGFFSADGMRGQALNMDGQSGIFFQPWAEVVPAAAGKFGGSTVSFHVVDAGPVAGDYLNVGVEEGFGNWLEFGFTRSNHTDGGDPAISPLFNFAGMNIFNFKTKVLAAGSHGRKHLPAISVGGVLRTNDPFVSQSVVHKNATNGDVYLVGTELFVFGKKFAFLLNGGVRGTNAEKYGYCRCSASNSVRASSPGFVPICSRICSHTSVNGSARVRQLRSSFRSLGSRGSPR